jgi:hypothetical protein
MDNSTCFNKLRIDKASAKYQEAMQRYLANEITLECSKYQKALFKSAVNMDCNETKSLNKY